MEALPTGYLTTESSQEAWWVFCLIGMLGWNSSKLREAAWSPRESRAQLMLTKLSIKEPKVGNEAWIVQEEPPLLQHSR